MFWEIFVLIKITKSPFDPNAGMLRLVMGLGTGAVFDNEKTVVYHPELLHSLENNLTEFYAEGDSLKDIIGVYSVEDVNCTIYHDMKGERLVCSLDGE